MAEQILADNWQTTIREASHVYAAAIANATRRSGVKVRSVPDAGDSFLAAAGRKHRNGCYFCFGGYVTIAVEEDGADHDQPMPCRRCNTEEYGSVSPT